MKIIFKFVIVIEVLSMLTACGSTLPLTFIDKTTAGVDISANDQGVDLDVGFNTKSLALVPVAVRKKDSSGVYSEVEKLQSKDGEKVDAYSTFGNFTLGTKGEAQAPTASVGLGRFFATGIAAQNIANRIGESMAKKAEKE